MHYLFTTVKGLYPMIPLKTPIENLSWVDGCKLDETFPVLEFIVDEESNFTWGDFIRPSANIPLFSPKFKSLLDQHGVDNIDYYDATITIVSTGETRPYFAANVIGMVNGLDREQSVYAPFDDNEDIAEEIDKLVLDETQLTGVNICRLSEYDLIIVVDELIKNIVEENNLIGARFVKPEDWTGMFT